ncbi:MAG: hypothetical protein ACP6IP_03600 [Candidatus Njordarchaeia archaeon]
MRRTIITVFFIFLLLSNSLSIFSRAIASPIKEAKKAVQKKDLGHVNWRKMSVDSTLNVTLRSNATNAFLWVDIPEPGFYTIEFYGKELNITGCVYYVNVVIRMPGRYQSTRFGGFVEKNITIKRFSIVVGLEKWAKKYIPFYIGRKTKLFITLGRSKSYCWPYTVTLFTVHMMKHNLTDKHDFSFFKGDTVTDTIYGVNTKVFNFEIIHPVFTKFNCTVTVSDSFSNILDVWGDIELMSFDPEMEYLEVMINGQCVKTIESYDDTSFPIDPKVLKYGTGNEIYVIYREKNMSADGVYVKHATIQIQYKDEANETYKIAFNRYLKGGNNLAGGNFYVEPRRGFKPPMVTIVNTETWMVLHYEMSNSYNFSKLVSLFFEPGSYYIIVSNLGDQAITSFNISVVESINLHIFNVGEEKEVTLDSHSRVKVFYFDVSSDKFYNLWIAPKGLGGFPALLQVAKVKYNGEYSLQPLNFVGETENKTFEISLSNILVVKYKTNVLEFPNFNLSDGKTLNKLMAWASYYTNSNSSGGITQSVSHDFIAVDSYFEYPIFLLDSSYLLNGTVNGTAVFSIVLKEIDTVEEINASRNNLPLEEKIVNFNGEESSPLIAFKIKLDSFNVYKFTVSTQGFFYYPMGIGVYPVNKEDSNKIMKVGGYWEDYYLVTFANVECIFVLSTPGQGNITITINIVENNFGELVGPPFDVVAFKTNVREGHTYRLRIESAGLGGILKIGPFTAFGYNGVYPFEEMDVTVYLEEVAVVEEVNIAYSLSISEQTTITLTSTYTGEIIIVLVNEYSWIRGYSVKIEFVEIGRGGNAANIASFDVSAFGFGAIVGVIIGAVVMFLYRKYATEESIPYSPWGY